MNLLASSRFIAATLVVAALAGCGTSAQQDACQGQKSGSEFTFNEAQQLTAQCVWFGYAGLPPRVHLVFFNLEDGTTLKVPVPMGQVVPAEIDLRYASPHPELMNFKGWEGADQSLCRSSASASGFVGGRLSLTYLSVRANGSVEGIHGTLEAEFDGCTVAALGVSNGPIKVRGTF